VFFTLCAALAVLVHHETSVTDASSMQGSMHAVHAMAAENPSFVAAPSAHGVETGGCDMEGMQHCTTASVDSVQLAVPGQSGFESLARLKQAAAGRTPTGVVGRAPPDLSVLSQLRI